MDIETLAIEAGLWTQRASVWMAFGGREELERFAVLMAGAEREECRRICRAVAAQYPTDVFPEEGESLDCKSASMARLTAANIEREIAERSNV